MTEYLADVLDPDGGGIGAVEVAFGVGGNEFGERGLAGTRWAVEDHASEAVGLEHASQQLALAEEVSLAGELVEGPGAHPYGQGLGGAEVGLTGLFPKVGHYRMIALRGYTGCMPPLPIMLNIRDKRCLIVGGGRVALRRAKILLGAGAVVAVVAPVCDPELTALPIELHTRPYQEGDVAGVALVVIATDDPGVNDTASRDARAAGAWVNRVDAPDLSDLTFPAQAHHGPITLAVSTGGISASASVTIRDELSNALDSDWERLLACATEYRAMIKERTANPEARREKLLKLADTQAMTILKERGEAALRAYYESL